jgi:hypothetical protein
MIISEIKLEKYFSEFRKRKGINYGCLLNVWGDKKSQINE